MIPCREFANTSRGHWRSRWRTLILALTAVMVSSSLVAAQTSPADQLADAALAEPPVDGQSPTSAGDDTQLSMPLLELTLRGGYLMIPIGLISIIVVAIGVERAIGLRRRLALPRPLVDGLSDMAARGALDVRRAQQLCEQFPSSLSRVAAAMLAKLGRPQSEVEHAVAEACQRESDLLYANVRTLNLATSVAPLLGLLGTVSGMIQAFFMTAHLPINVNKSEALAEGIYIALVTTFAGLSVAIPAAVLVHLFESRILRLLRDVEQSVGTLLPQVERLEGTKRVDPRPAGPHIPSTTWPISHPESKAS